MARDRAGLVTEPDFAGDGMNRIRFERLAERMRSAREDWRNSPLPPSVKKIITEEAALGQVHPAFVRDTSNHYREVVRIRRRVIVRLRSLGFSTPLIGRYVGGMDHSSVLYNLRVAAQKGLQEQVYEDTFAVNDEGC